MFRIGEFAQIAQVSGRQLRFYDERGLLRPVRTDPRTGYRYYSIRQLPRLNSILALKELGFSLDQIGPMVDKSPSPAELRAMLAMKRAQVERSLQEEEARLRNIESRIAQIDRQGEVEGFDVMVKSVPATPFLSMRCVVETMEEAVTLVRAVADGGGRQIKPMLRKNLIVVARNDREDDRLDLEIGFSLARKSNASLHIAGGHVLTANELPAVERMATIVRPGADAAAHASFGAVGVWIEVNGYEIAGPCREVFLEPVTGPPGLDAALVEIQFPVRRAA